MFSTLHTEKDVLAMQLYFAKSLMSAGVLEYWNTGVLDFIPLLHCSTTPSLHYSITPVFVLAKWSTFPFVNQLIRNPAGRPMSIGKIH